MAAAHSKIRISLLAVSCVALAASLISLSYARRMVRTIETMATVDARMLELGEEISIRMLEARRDEKNYIITYDSTYILQSRNILGDIRGDISGSKGIAGSYTEVLDSISRLVDEYENSLVLLQKTFREDPRLLYRLQEQMINYEKDLRLLARKSNIRTEDMPAWSTDISLILSYAAGKLSSDKAEIIQDLKRISSRIHVLAQNLASDAQTAFYNRSQEGVRTGEKAQRDILTLLLVSGLALGWAAYKLPKYILSPVRTLLKALKTAARGDTDQEFPVLETHDEFTELSAACRTAIGRLQYFNRLRVDKITEKERHFQKLIDELEEGIVRLTPDLTVTQFNRTAAELFDIRAEHLQKPLSGIEALWNLVQAPLAAIDQTGRTELRARLPGRMLKKHTVILVPQKDESSKTAGILMIIR
ncbi:HAMP domain-containing protein [bacterium]|nr:HAMP domain-containing protein [bacterium]